MQKLDFIILYNISKNQLFIFQFAAKKSKSLNFKNRFYLENEAEIGIEYLDKKDR